MKLKNKIVGGLLRMKNRQIRAERDKSRALSETNSILSAYVASLIEDRNGARISKDQIRKAIGKYTAQVLSDGADYVISVIRSGNGYDGAASCEPAVAKQDVSPDEILPANADKQEQFDVRD